MKIIAILAVLLGVMAVISPRMNSGMTPNYSAQVIALNYIAYRTAVHLHVFKSKPTGIISQSELTLPAGYKALHAWTARVDNGRCYVYGPATSEEISEVRDLLHGSLAVGRASGGFLWPDGKANLPAYIPTESLVSVVEVN